jgi:hypothetical protein
MRSKTSSQHLGTALRQLCLNLACASCLTSTRQDVHGYGNWLLPHHRCQLRVHPVRKPPFRVRCPIRKTVRQGVAAPAPLGSGRRARATEHGYGDRHRLTTASQARIAPLGARGLAPNNAACGSYSTRGGSRTALPCTACGCWRTLLLRPQTPSTSARMTHARRGPHACTSAGLSLAAALANLAASRSACFRFSRSKNSCGVPE